MSVGQSVPFGGGPYQTNGVDLEVNNKSYPSVQLAGTEIGAGTSTVIEIAGATWITANAAYSPVYGGFQQVNPAVGSAALIINPSGTFQKATAAAGANTPISWTYTTF